VHGSERARVELLRALFETDASDAVLRAIGDDAAVLAPSTEPLVWTIDAAVEGVHFRREWLTLRDLGFRATMAAASDLAAMGARPLALLSALVLPPSLSDEELRELAAGQREAADALGTTVVGGNLARGDAIAITTTVLGAAAKPIPRDGAQPGDAIFIAGPVGLAAAGRLLIERGIAAATPAQRMAVDAFRRPTARVVSGLAAHLIAHAAIDVSDGLARDLGHLARASGVTAVLDPSSLASPLLREVAAALDEDPLQLALYGGEDYALLIAAPADAALEGFVRIGHCEPAVRSYAVALAVSAEEHRPIHEGGFDHFAG
jgi:thiamine-monophosphate kinase